MKRFTRRMLVVMAGLVLGWYTAALVPTGTASASGGAIGADAAGRTIQDEAGHSSSEGHSDEGLTATEALRPSRCEIAWLRPVMIGIGTLFAGAVVLGIPAMKVRGPDLPNPDANDEE